MGSVSSLMGAQEGKMAKYSDCPNCGRKPGRGLMGHYIEILRCLDCNKLFCRQCSGSGGQCPQCGSKRKTKDGSAH
jgi:hypothetical protein